MQTLERPCWWDPLRVLSSASRAEELCEMLSSVDRGSSTLMIPTREASRGGLLVKLDGSIEIRNLSKFSIIVDSKALEQ